MTYTASQKFIAFFSIRMTIDITVYHKSIKIH